MSQLPSAPKAQGNLSVSSPRFSPLLRSPSSEPLASPTAVKHKFASKIMTRQTARIVEQTLNAAESDSLPNSTAALVKTP